MKILYHSQLGKLTSMLLFISSSYCLAEYPRLDPQGKYVEGEVIIKFKEGFDGTRSKEETSSLQEAVGATSVQTLPSIGAQVWRINELPNSQDFPNPDTESLTINSEPLSTEEIIQQLKDNPLVEYVEPNYIISATTLPNDTDFSKLWGLHNTGQLNGNPDADIDAPEAWDITTGGQVVIAVIDTGVNNQHPDLSANMWKNPNEVPGNGKDDDGNGYIDDIYGYDFANEDANPSDDYGHGSHCAGIIAGVGNNGMGITGINWKAQIMIVKFLNSFGLGSIVDAIRALEYAVKMGAKISNNSYGCNGCISQALYDAIQASGTQGHLFVTSAGNSAEDNDTHVVYPANYDLENIIVVAATDNKDKLSNFSNYGKKNVDLAAPGEHIYSTLLEDQYGYKSGTSMSTPYVVGVASLLKGCQPGWTFKEIKDRLLETVDILPALQDKLVSHGRLNAFKAVKNVCQPLVATLGYFTAIPLQHHVVLQWETEMEKDSAGFNLWRTKTPADGQCKNKRVEEYQDITKLTDRLISAKGSPFESTSYSYEDDQIVPKTSYCYGLEEIAKDGTSTFYWEWISMATAR